MTGRRWLVVALAAAALAATLGFVRWRAEDDGPLTEEEAETVVGDYLDAVEREDYPAAAQLAGGDSDPSALADHCRDGCLAATGIVVDADGSGRYVAVVTFGEPRGHPLQRSFVVGEDDDGRPYVRGLPPAGTGTIVPSFFDRNRLPSNQFRSKNEC